MKRIESDKKVIAELINKHFPDWRRILNECQRYSVSGKIDSGILVTFSDVAVDDLIKKSQREKLSEVRKWVNDNMDNDTSVLLRRIYDALYKSFALKPSLLLFLLLLSISIRWHLLQIKRSIYLACLTEIMVECEFK